MRRNGCALRMMHACYRWMRPRGATRAGTQAPPLPASVTPLCHATFPDLVHRQSPRRQSFLDLVHQRRLFRQPTFLACLSIGERFLSRALMPLEHGCQELCGVAFACFGNGFGGALGNNLSAARATFGADVDDVVGQFDDV